MSSIGGGSGKWGHFVKTLAPVSMLRTMRGITREAAVWPAVFRPSDGRARVAFLPARAPLDYVKERALLSTSCAALPCGGRAFG
jgi:hypothetical protein